MIVAQFKKSIHIINIIFTAGFMICLKSNFSDLGLVYCTIQLPSIVTVNVGKMYIIYLQNEMNFDFYNSYCKHVDNNIISIIEVY